MAQVKIRGQISARVWLPLDCLIDEGRDGCDPVKHLAVFKATLPSKVLTCKEYSGPPRRIRSVSSQKGSGVEPSLRAEC